MKLFIFLIIFSILVFSLSCAVIPAFHNTADTELEKLSESLTNRRLEDLFRQHPTLKFAKSTDIGNDNTCHEFLYVITENEDMSQRTLFQNKEYSYKRELTYSINIFVDNSGIIYEVLNPVISNIEIKTVLE